MFQTNLQKKIKAHIFSSRSSPPPLENRVLYEIMWKHIVDPDRPQMTIRHMRIACWITKATNKHSEYVILSVCPLQQRLHEHASVLRYTHISRLVFKIISYILASQQIGRGGSYCGGPVGRDQLSLTGPPQQVPTLSFQPNTNTDPMFEILDLDNWQCQKYRS